MFPGMNPKQMQKALKRLGIKQQDIEASEVIIKCPDKDLIIENPQVTKVNMAGQETFQISGNVKEKEPVLGISKEDIKTVAEQANVSEQKAKKALEKNNGDLAKAILDLTS